MTDLHGAEAPPSDWIVRFLPQASRALPVLDLAAGGGRHTRLARALGFKVVATDINTDRLTDLAGDPRITVVAADIEDGAPWPFGTQQFGAVIVANYLHRPILPTIVEAAAPGGLLIYETFARGNEAYGRPRNPDYLLKEGELLDAVSGRLTVVAYEHGLLEEPGPRVVQRLCARASGGDDSLMKI